MDSNNQTDCVDVKPEVLLTRTLSAFKHQNNQISFETKLIPGIHPFSSPISTQSSKKSLEIKPIKEKLFNLNSRQLGVLSFSNKSIKRIKLMTKQIEQLQLIVNKTQQQYCNSLTKLKTLKCLLESCGLYSVALEELQYQKERKKPVEVLILPPLKIKNQNQQVDAIKNQLNPLFGCFNDERFEEIPNSFITTPY